MPRSMGANWGEAVREQDRMAAIDTAVGGVAVTDAEETYSVSPKTRP